MCSKSGDQSSWFAPGQGDPQDRGTFDATTEKVLANQDEWVILTVSGRKGGVKLGWRDDAVCWDYCWHH